MVGLKPAERTRPLRGKPYSVGEFQERYDLDRGTAEDLYRRFGPSSIELDLLMAAKRRRPSLSVMIEDITL